jgi:hypothetical protein
MDMKFLTCNIRSLYRAGTLIAISMKLFKYRLDLVGMQKVKWEGSSTIPARAYTFLYGKGNENHGLGTGFLYKGEPYQQLRGLGLLVIVCHT